MSCRAGVATTVHWASVGVPPPQKKCDVPETPRWPPPIPTAWCSGRTSHNQNLKLLVVISGATTNFKSADSAEGIREQPPQHTPLHSLRFFHNKTRRQNWFQPPPCSCVLRPTLCLMKKYSFRFAGACNQQCATSAPEIGIFWQENGCWKVMKSRQLRLRLARPLLYLLSKTMKGTKNEKWQDKRKTKTDQ